MAYVGLSVSGEVRGALAERTRSSSIDSESRTSAATAGMNEKATAGAWRGGEATNACAVISSPMKIEDRRDGGLRQEAHEQRDRRRSRRRAPIDEAGGERVARPRAHGLVRGVTDIRRVLDDTAAGARGDRRPAPRSAGCPACGTRLPPRARDSVSSMPPTTVATRERQGERQVRRGSWSRRGQPRERRPRWRECQRERGRRMRHRPAPSEPSAPRRCALPASTAAKRPREPPGQPEGRRPAVARTSDEGDQRPTSGSAKTFSEGRNAIEQASRRRRSSRAARRAGRSGATAVAGEGERRASRPRCATVTPHPDLPGQDRIAREHHRRPEHAEHHAPKSDGVSMPKGIAVTSVRPARPHQSGAASHV